MFDTVRAILRSLFLLIVLWSLTSFDVHAGKISDRRTVGQCERVLAANFERLHKTNLIEAVSDLDIDGANKGFAVLDTEKLLTPEQWRALFNELLSIAEYYDPHFPNPSGYIFHPTYGLAHPYVQPFGRLIGQKPNRPLQFNYPKSKTAVIRKFANLLDAFLRKHVSDLPKQDPSSLQVRILQAGTEYRGSGLHVDGSYFTITLTPLGDSTIVVDIDGERRDPPRRHTLVLSGRFRKEEHPSVKPTKHAAPGRNSGFTISESLPDRMMIIMNY